jgi:hypothetical protein
LTDRDGDGIGAGVETRHVIAYGLIVAVAVIGGIVGLVAQKRRIARRRRLRGIKDYNSGGR